jgi:hypothetical protein
MSMNSEISQLSSQIWKPKPIQMEVPRQPLTNRLPPAPVPETPVEMAVAALARRTSASKSVSTARNGSSNPSNSSAPTDSDALPPANSLRSQADDLAAVEEKINPAALQPFSASRMSQLASVNRLAHDRIAALPRDVWDQVVTAGHPDNLTMLIPPMQQQPPPEAINQAKQTGIPWAEEVFHSRQSPDGTASVIGRRLIGDEWYNFGTDTNIASSQPASTWIAPTRLLRSANPAQEKDLSAQRVIRDTQSLVEGPWKPYLKGAGLAPKPHTFDMRHSDKDGIKSVLATLNKITGTLQTIQKVTKGIEKGMEFLGMMGALGQLGSYMSIFNQMKLPGSPGELITALITGKGINPNKPPAPPTADQTGSGKNGVLVTKGGAAAAAIGNVDVMILEGKLKISGPPEYVAAVKQDLYLIAMTKTGGKTLESLANSGQVVEIRPWDSPPARQGNSARANEVIGAYPPPVGTGQGTGTTISYNPNEQGRPPGSPSVAGLNHELGHADHNAHGENSANVPVLDPTTDDGLSNNEEASTIANYDNPFRDELGLPPRMGHGDLP